jgi:membrane-associated phospholipid phosphatase
MIRVFLVFLFVVLGRVQGNAVISDSTIALAHPVFFSSVGLLGGGMFFHYDHSLHHKEKFHARLQSFSPENKTNVEEYLRYAPALSVYALDLAGIKAKNGFIQRTILLGASQLVMSGVTLGLKNNLSSLRPDGSDFKSLPSGTAAQAFMAATFLHYEMRDYSPWIAVSGYALATVSSGMRIAANKHWLGDVLIGAGIGMLSTHLIYWLLESPANQWVKKSIFKNKDTQMSFVPAVSHETVGMTLVWKVQ